MNNEPNVKIEYLVDYELTITSNFDHEFSNPININNDVVKIGKKGFHLSGGSVDEITKEVSGCIMDGTYTFYDENKKYLGLLGNSLSRNDYLFIKSSDYTSYTGAELQSLVDNATSSSEETFDGYCSESSKNFEADTVYRFTLINGSYEYYVLERNPYINIVMTQNNTYLKSIIIYFDNIANEYAKKIVFSDNSSKIYNNEKLLFMRSFGEESTLTENKIIFTEWSKKNSLAKILKIKTGLSVVYDTQSLQKVYYTRDKFSDVNDLKFGVSKQVADLEILDNDGFIKELYDKDLIFKNIQVRIYIDNMLEGSYIIEAKEGQNIVNYWSFDCKDIISLKLEEVLPLMNIPLDTNNDPIPKSLLYFIKYALQNSGINVIYDSGLEDELDTIIIPIPFVNPKQTRYDLLLKCCQIGLLRIYSNNVGNLIISRGL